MKLVIVESPTKSKTIAHYLGDEYSVEASVGHVRDLSISGKGGLGIDIENNFEPTYSINDDKKEVVVNLKKLCKKADEVLLATDPDREGEAIAWHLMDVLKLPLETTKRLEFYEITRDSVLEAIKNPRTIDMNLVHSQEARRIIDRILGFRLSTLLKSKIKSKSAGRVQSVTLKIVCDREQEINNFVKEEYWTINPSIICGDRIIDLKLSSKDTISNEKEAYHIKDLMGDKAKVINIEKSDKSSSSKEPYRTSTLQQDASAKLKFKLKETSLIAQQLYEGVEINGDLVGLITYMRTDSTRISEVFANKAKDYIIETYGKEYYKGAKRGKSVKLSQDAHECIRPTSIKRTPESLKKYLSEKQYKLYKLIYNRTLASLMSDKLFTSTKVIFNLNNIEAECVGKLVTFKGYDILKIDDKDNFDLPEFNVGEEYKINEIICEQKFTEPPSRYTEGKLVKVMEEKGIGRPSTYASTVQTLIQRKYISNTTGYLIPSEQGKLTAVVLNKYFPDLMNTEYTAEMETRLDKIQDGEENELEVIREFYEDFQEHYEKVKQIMYKEPLKTTGEKCPVCGSDLVIRTGKYGDFVSCSNYPTCKYIKKDEKNEPTKVGRLCPDCGHELIYRQNKKGDKFIGCSNFPKCRYTEGIKQESAPEAEEKTCPDCGNKLVIKKSRRGYFYGCSNYPACKHVEPFVENKNTK